MEKNTLVLLLLIPLIVFSAGCVSQPNPEPTDCPACETLSEEKGLITTYTFDWGVNELDETEVLVDVTVFNYGYMEAKNIEITCKLYESSTLDGPETLVKTVKQNIGNVASVTISFEQVAFNYEVNPDKYYSPLCYASDCSECELLDMRILELKEVYEEE